MFELKIVLIWGICFCRINLTFWDDLAHVAFQHLEKGNQIYVSGRLISDAFETSEGKQQTYYKVFSLASQVYVLWCYSVAYSLRNLCSGCCSAAEFCREELPVSEWTGLGFLYTRQVVFSVM